MKLHFRSFPSRGILISLSLNIGHLFEIFNELSLYAEYLVIVFKADLALKDAVK